MIKGVQVHTTGSIWQVEGEVIRVLDGDTIEARVDLGWRIQFQIIVRLDGIDAPELPTLLGEQARLFLGNLLPVGTRVIVTSNSLDKYGRTVGKVVARDTGADAAARLVAAGMAQFRQY